MKLRKKKIRKPSDKAKGRGGAGDLEDGEDASSWLREVWGLAALALSLVTFIALISEFVSPGKNILGPYLGSWWAGVLTRFAGGFPVLFLVAAVTALGLKLVLNREGITVRLISALSLLFLAVGVLLSIRNIGKDNLLPADYQVTGGWLGNFLAQKCLLPFFGPSHFGPYLVTAIALLFILVLGFKVSAVSLSEKSAAVTVFVLRPFFLGLAKLWGKVPEGEAAEEAKLSEPKSLPKPSGDQANAKTDAVAKRTKPPAQPEVRPEEKPPASSETPSAPKARRSEPERDEAVDAILEELNAGRADVEELEPTVIHKLRDLLDSGKIETEELDPLVIRKIRDLALERKRVSELNEWEQRARHPEIGGVLKGGKPDRVAPQMEAAAPPEAEKPIPEVAAKGIRADLAEAESGDPEPASARAMESGDEGDGEGETPEYAAEGEAEADPDGGVEVEYDAAAFKLEPKSVPAKPPKPEVKYDDYRVPAIDDIFPDPPTQPLEFTAEELREQSKLLEDQLLNFKVMGKVLQILPGPVITRYEVELAPGVKVNRISNLADDLALALRAKSIRILAPIPGKSVVGVEVPNRKSQIVYIKEILKSPDFTPEEDTLKITVGKTIGGDPYVMDLTRAPHLLIAGQTGSGKSVCINSIMTSFLCSKTPDELRMILVDPKVVELKPYDNIPHLLYPVITQPETAVQALKWCTVEMDRRYDVLARAGVRNIKGFNQKFREGRLPGEVEEEDRKVMPFMVIIIDELADLMMVAGKEVETNIARIAQKARAVGIHLILATQRPSTNVITGTIKANLPTRISFQVASQIDARTIMDKMGAEKLLGRGDMLFRPIEFPEPIRLHGCYVDDEQTENLTAFCSGQFVNYPQLATFSLEDDLGIGGEADEERDEKFREAAELVVQVKQASVSLLQRRLGIGYARSGRLVDQLERAGIVGRERGSKAREVLMDEDELRSFLSSGLNG